MQQVINMLDDVIFNLKLEKYEAQQHLHTLSKKLKVHPKQILRGGVSVAAAFVGFIVFLFAKEFVYLCLSIGYPAFMTAKTLSQENAYSRDGKLYLSYWVCFAFLSIFNLPLNFILRHIPFSYFVQCLFTIWLYSQKTRGAEHVGNHLFTPLFRKIGFSEDVIKQPVETGMSQ